MQNLKIVKKKSTGVEELIMILMLQEKMHSKVASLLDYSNRLEITEGHSGSLAYQEYLLCEYLDVFFKEKICD